MYKIAENFLFPSKVQNIAQNSMSLFSTKHSWELYTCDSSSHCIRYRPRMFNVTSNSVIQGNYTAYSCIFIDVSGQRIREL